MNLKDSEYTVVSDRIRSVTQPERKALREAFEEGLRLTSSMDLSGFHNLLEAETGGNAAELVEGTKVSCMLASVNRHLDPFRSPDQRLNTQAARTYLESLEENVLRRFLSAVVDLEEKTLTVADPVSARIQPVLVGQELLEYSRRLPPPTT